MTEYIISENTVKKANDLIGFLSDGKHVKAENIKYLYLRVNDDESIFFRDAAFSLIIACLNSSHPHIRKCLDQIGGEHNKLWQNLEKK